MKSKFVKFALLMFVSLSAFAQKDELKVLKKIYTKEIPSANDIVEYKSNLAKLENSAVEESDKVYKNFYKSMLPIVEITALGTNATPEKIATFITVKNISDFSAGLIQTLEFEKKSGKKVYTDNINTVISNNKFTLLNYAITLGKEQKNKEAASVLYNTYLLDKSDVENLYYAASYAVNGQDYDLALEYYKELVKLNFSGEATLYYAKNLASDTEESFSKEERDRYVKLKTHANPRDEKVPSKRGEIYKNIALIYVQKGKIEEAKKAILDARTSNPDDTSLILTEANLYLDTKDFVTYKKLITEILQKNPNDADLYYNLGVVTYNNKELADAEKYYLKAIEINPKYANAYLNLAILKLDAEKDLIDKMNKILGTSSDENKRYAVLKKQREDVFNSTIPYLEKAVELDENNIEAAKTLLNVYNALEMTDKAKVLKAKINK